MDKGMLALMIPLLALAIGMVSVITHGAIKLQQEKNKGLRTAPGGDTIARVDALEQEVQGLREQLSEAQERIDFAERLLARGREAEGRSAR